MVAASAVEAGGRVIWLDYEDNSRLLAGRADMLGFEGALNLARFAYAHPTLYEDMESWPPNVAAAISYLLGAKDPTFSLMVLDSAESAGCPSDGSDIAAWYQTYIRPWLDAPVGVLLIDHVVKRAEGRPRGPIGSQAKLAKVTGAALLVEGIPWTKQAGGRLTLRGEKDRVGDLPAAAGRVVCEVRGTYSQDGEFTYIFDEPARQDGAVDIPTARELLEALSGHPDGLRGQRGYRELIQGRDSKKDGAMEWLVAGGFVAQTPAGKAFHYTVTEKGTHWLMDDHDDDGDDE